MKDNEMPKEVLDIIIRNMYYEDRALRDSEKFIRACFTLTSSIWKNHETTGTELEKSRKQFVCALIAFIQDYTSSNH